MHYDNGESTFLQKVSIILLSFNFCIGACNMWTWAHIKYTSVSVFKSGPEHIKLKLI